MHKSILAALLALWGLAAPAVAPAAMTLGLGQELEQALNPAAMPLPEDANGYRETRDVPVSRGEVANVLRQDTHTGIPQLNVQPLQLAGASIDDALRLVLDGTPLTYTIVGGGSYAPATVYNLRGPLPKVLDELSHVMGFFYTYENGVLRVTPNRQFTLELPPVPGLDASVAASLESMGAQSVQVNKETGLVSFSATRPVADNIKSWVEKSLADLKMLTYEVAIIEVRLNNGNTVGIDWSGTFQKGDVNFSFGSGAASAVAGALTGGLVHTGKYLSLQLIMSFLDTQGAAKILSQPKVSLVSGGSYTLNSTTKTSYVSQVSAMPVGYTDTTTTTASTSDITTGMTLNIAGRYRDGTVFTSVTLKLSELLAMTSRTVGETTLELPTSGEREFSTPLTRVKPGETMLLGGIIVSRDESNRQSATGVPVLSTLLGRTTDATSRSELVVMLTPRLIEFPSDFAKGALK